MQASVLFILTFLSFSSFAQKLELEIISAEFGVEDELNQKTLCLTVLRVPENGELLGLVEGIEDCFYARLAHRSTNNKLMVDFKTLTPLFYPKLKDHLQKLDTQLKFYFSEGD